MIVEHPILVSISGPSMRQTVYAVQNDTGRIFRIKFKDYDISSYSTGSLKWELGNGSTGSISGEVSNGMLIIDPSEILEYEGPFKCIASVNDVDSTFFNLNVMRAIDEEGWTPPPEPQPSDITVESKSITENGTYTAPTGKAYSPVTVNVPNTYAAGDEGKVVSNGALVSQSSASYTENGTYDTTLKNSVTVNVSGGSSSMGGLDNMVDVADPEYSPAFMLSAMKNKQTVGGKLTVATWPNTEQLLLSTGLTVIHGIIFSCPTYKINQTSVTGQTNRHALFWGRNFEDTVAFTVFGTRINNAVNSAFTYTNNTASDGGVPNGTLRFDGGDIYYKARYNKNANYQLIYPNVEYEWLAW